MHSEDPHQSFNLFPRRSQTLRNDRCQNILYKAVFEHFTQLNWIAALLLTSKSFQNSSFGANFLINFVVDKDSIRLLQAVLSPSSCFSLQFVPSLHIKQANRHHEKINRGIAKFVDKIVCTTYLHLSLRSLTLDSVANEVLSFFFGSSSSNAWPNLRDLSLEYSELNDDVLEIISTNAGQLRTVGFSGSSEITDAGLEHVCKLSHVLSLTLWDCQLITDAGLQHIAKLSSITNLNLSWNLTISDAGLEHISELADITSLDLSNCSLITDAGLDFVSKLSSIRSINLSGCNIGDAALEHIAKLSETTSLDLRSCEQITDAGLEHLSKLLGITFLDLASCELITDVGLEHICKLSNINALDLSRCFEVTDAGLEHVAKLCGITSLELAYNEQITGVGLQRVEKLSNMTFLNLWGCFNITPFAKTKLRTVLANCKIKEHDK